MNIMSEIWIGFEKLFPQKSKNSVSHNTRHLGHQAASKKRSGKPADDELADLWLSAYPRTAFGLGEFRRYQDGIWHLLPLDKARKEILEIMVGEKDDGIRPTKSLVESVLGLARSIIFVPDDEWDNQPDYIPCKNGVLHIPTHILHQHSPDFHFTACLDFDYDPAATCPNFLKFWTHPDQG